MICPSAVDIFAPSNPCPSLRPMKRWHSVGVRNALEKEDVLACINFKLANRVHRGA